MLSGRELPLEVGLLCHERVPDLAGGVRLTSSGDSFSLVGDDNMLASESPSRSMDSSRVRSVFSVASARGVVIGESNFSGGSARRAVEVWLYWRLERGEGVFAGDDFWGDIDRARSDEH